MSTPSPSAVSTILTPAEILAHPSFDVGRAAFVDGVMALHEGDAYHGRLLVEAMRQVTFNIIISLHLNHDVADRATWPTPRRLKDELKTFGLSSERRIDALVNRFIQLGYVEQLPSDLDGRMRILTPTPKMMSIDREWLVYHYAPLHVMFPNRGYGEPMAHGGRVRIAGRQRALYPAN